MALGAGALAALRGGVGGGARTALIHAWRRTERRYGADSRMARTWSVSTMAGWVLVLLLGFLLMYYV